MLPAEWPPYRIFDQRPRHGPARPIFPLAAEGSSPKWVMARRFKGRRRNLEILSVSQRRLAAYR